MNKNQNSKFLVGINSAFFFRFNLLFLLIGLLILVNGYICFRGDHLTQIPLYYKSIDKNLYPNDYFLEHSGEEMLRFFHLWLIRIADSIFGSSLGIFIVYTVILYAIFIILTKIAKKIFSSEVFGIIIISFAIFYFQREAGGNHVLEPSLIPRLEAFLFVCWGFYLLLCSRYILAGIITAIGGYFQPAISLIFVIPLIVWMLVTDLDMAGSIMSSHYFSKRILNRIRNVIKFIIPYLIFMSPWFFLLESYTDSEQVLSSAERVTICAYIRQPQHMFPHFWIRKWIVFFPLFILSLLVWKSKKGNYPELNIIFKLIWVIVLILIGFTVFIYIFPIESVILFQPFRAMIFLYLFLYFILSIHIYDLFKERRWLSTLRAVFILMSGKYSELAFLILLYEIFLIVSERRKINIPFKLKEIIFYPTFTVSLIMRFTKWKYLLLILIVSAIVFYIQKFYEKDKKKLFIRLSYVPSLLLILFYTSFYIIDYKNLDCGERLKRIMYEFNLKYQLNPIPITAIEVVGEWAEKNTPLNSLFLIPPERKEDGFRIWSKRSVFFTVKHFPFSPLGMKMWEERYLTIWGILPGEEEIRKELLEEALKDADAMKINKVFIKLTPDYILKLSQFFDIDYLISPVLYYTDKFKLIYSANDLHLKNPERLYLYKINNNELS